MQIRKHGDMFQDEIYLEYHIHGNITKVSAICSRSKIEVSVSLPSSLNKKQMNFYAIQKLNYIKRKNSQNS